MDRHKQANEEILINEIRRNFRHLGDKRIFIYGTGIIGRRVLYALAEKEVLGFLDYIKMSGSIEEVPILTWEDIHKGMADVIIIAATIPHQPEIYNRIIYNCIYFDLQIYNAQGWNLSYLSRLKMLPIQDTPYYKLSLGELFHAIDKHEKISFDLFDTILARKVLEPADLFDLVEMRANKREIFVDQFKKKRKTAEIECPGKDIYDIYVKFEELYGIDKEVCNTLLDIELQCEREMILCRKDIVKAFQYALDKGKKVSIISDMYIPSQHLVQILSGLGIEGYDKIYVSCEYGCSKGSGLYNIYLRDNKNCRSFLHIGDHPIADGKMANKAGIDVFLIKSGLDLMRMSNLRGLMVYANREIDRCLLGDLIADIFNSPFSLYSSAGIVHIKTLEQFASYFITPLVAIYMKTLSQVLRNRKYKSVLFGARDGYLFYKIYQEGFLNPESKSIPGIYFLVSRRLALRATAYDERIFDEINQWFGNKFSYWERLFPELFKDMEDGKCISGMVLDYRERVKAVSSQYKKRYLGYMDRECIDLRKEYLYCDLISSGTIQNSLNCIFEKELDGFYLQYWEKPYTKKTLSVKGVYGQSEWVRITNITNILEKVLTNSVPPVMDVDNSGNLIYEEEYRGKAELDMVGSLHKEIFNKIRDTYYWRESDQIPDKELVFGLMFLFQDVVLEGTASIMNGLRIKDDLLKTETKIGIVSE